MEQNTAAYQKVLDRLTNIILIYSAIAFYLIPIIQDVFIRTEVNWILYISFSVFAILFLSSMFFTIKLLVPETLAYLDAPRKYYDDIRIQYENDPDIIIKYPDIIVRQKEVDKLIQSSYILELQISVDQNWRVFRRKSAFYYRAIVFGLLATMPYIVCVGFHITKKEDNIQKVELVKSAIRP